MELRVRTWSLRSWLDLLDLRTKVDGAGVLFSHRFLKFLDSRRFVGLFMNVAYLHPPGSPRSTPRIVLCQSGTGVEVKVFGNKHVLCLSTLPCFSEPGDGTRKPSPASSAALLGELTLPSSRTGWLTNARNRVPFLRQTLTWILLSSSGSCPVS